MKPFINVKNHTLKLSFIVAVLVGMCMPLTMQKTALAATYLPWNTPITLRAGSCTLTFSHGKYLQTAYAKIKVQPGLQDNQRERFVAAS